MSAGGEPEDLTPAERRVRELLGQLAGTPVEPGRELAIRVLRTARWQRVVRSVVQASGGVLSAVADGLSLLLPRARRDP